MATSAPSDGLELDRPITIIPHGPVTAVMRAPGSKSLTNRALITAALADGTSPLVGALDADDTVVMARGLEALGAKIEQDGVVWTVEGTGGDLRVPDRPIHCGLSGTTIRFLAAVATLAKGPVELTGFAPLLERPIGPLLDALGTLGAEVAGREGGLPPVRTSGTGLRGGQVRVDAAMSSQFATALLLVAPLARRDVTVTVANLGAAGYVTMTAALLRDWGVEVIDLPDGVHVSTGRGYRAREFKIEHDASAAAHLFAFAVATGGSVTITNAPPTSQPDADIVKVFVAMGATLEIEARGLTLTGPEIPKAIDVDLRAMPDQLATIAALAALAEGTTTITGVEVTRGHETDRVVAVATELRNLGIVVEEHPDGLTIHGGTVRGGTVATHHDHRMAMGFAPLAARVPGIAIADPGCVTKTYPRFWHDVADDFHLAFTRVG